MLAAGTKRDAGESCSGSFYDEGPFPVSLTTTPQITTRHLRLPLATTEFGNHADSNSLKGSLYNNPVIVNCYLPNIYQKVGSP